MIYFTSDLHFYHENVIRYCDRPFANASEMDIALVANWNSIISDSDDVYILGDVSLRKADDVNAIVSQLNGRKFLITGNHDQFARSEKLKQNLFRSITPYLEIREHDTFFVLSHYPFMSWNKFMRGSVNLHGHIHAKEDYNTENALAGLNRFDVGVDANNFFPVSIETIIQWTKVNPLANRVDYHRTK